MLYINLFGVALTFSLIVFQIINMYIAMNRGDYSTGAISIIGITFAAFGMGICLINII